MNKDYKQLETDYFQQCWLSHEDDVDVLMTRQQNLPKLRLLSSYLLRNTFIAPGLRESVVNYTVGKKLVVKPLYRKTVHKRIHNRLTRDLAGIDKSRSESLVNIMRKATGMTFEKGDAIIHVAVDRKRKSTDTSSFVEVINASRIKTPPKYRKDANVIEGVRRSDGIIVGAYVRKLQDVTTVTRRLDRDEDFTYLPFFKDVTLPDGTRVKRRVAMLMKAGTFSETDQTRGLPPLTPSMNLIRYYEDYLNVLLVNKRVSGAVVGFTKTVNKHGTTDALANHMNQGLGYRGMMAPGTIASLQPGEDITFLTPRASSEGDDMFNQRILRLIAHPIRIPYELAYQDLSAVNFASWKSGQIELISSLTGWDIEAMKMAHMVVNNILLEYHIKGITNLTPDQIRLQIYLPRTSILDPEKTSRSEKIDLTNKSKSLHGLHDEHGTDYESTYEEQVAEAVDDIRKQAKVLVEKKKLSEEHGIVFPDDQEPEKRDTSSSRRPGESEGPDLDEEDARERRKEDDND